MPRKPILSMVLAGVCTCSVAAQAEVVIETITVGNPGNPDDTHGEGYGGVNYVYEISKFEVTAGQYAEFLNAVGADDAHGLYNVGMTLSFGCNIRRTGSPGSYVYLVDADEDGLEDTDWIDRPVNYVSWGDAARFANWLHNGQPRGIQDLTTTEDGSYYLNGATSIDGLMAVVREADATWVIPSENEWYKAAYHKNDGVTGNYFDYPTSSDDGPVSECCPGGNNSANYDANGVAPGGEACGPPYYRNVVGCYGLSASPYGTFDQAGNVWEWNETAPYDSVRGLRGGSFDYDGTVQSLRAAGHFSILVTTVDKDIGFRLAELPQPDPGLPTLPEWGLVTMALLILTAGTMLFRRRQAAV